MQNQLTILENGRVLFSKDNLQHLSPNLSRLLSLTIQSLTNRNCLRIEAYLNRRFERVLRSALFTLQTEIVHRLYHKDETVKIYDCKVVASEWGVLKSGNDKVRAFNVFGHLFHERLYKGNVSSGLRSAVRIRPIAMEAIIEFMVDRCIEYDQKESDRIQSYNEEHPDAPLCQPPDRLAFCQRVYASNLSLYHKTLIISHHIPEFRPHWHCDRPKWHDEHIEDTFAAYCLKREAQLALHPEDAY